MLDPYFTSDGDHYHATSACSGPWDPGSLHGAVVVALLAYEVEKLFDTDVYMPARMTTDMYRLPRFDPIKVKTTVVRDGYRIKVVDAEFFSADQSMARATCQLLRKTENSPIKAWSPDNWDVPDPELMDAAPDPKGRLGKHRRAIKGGIGTFGPKQTWLAEQRCLVDDEPLSPWMRAALIADYTNPFANSGDGGLGYINSDVTQYLHRLPVDEWIGLEVVNHQASDGVALGECRIYDRKGSIGISAVTSLAQKKRAD